MNKIIYLYTIINRRLIVLYSNLKKPTQKKASIAHRDISR